MAVGRETLRALVPSCGHDGEDGMWIHSACHPEMPTWCLYADGVLRIECALCKKKIVEVRVAD